METTTVKAARIAEHFQSWCAVRQLKRTNQTLDDPRSLFEWMFQKAAAGLNSFFVPAFNHHLWIVIYKKQGQSDFYCETYGRAENLPNEFDLAYHVSQNGISVMYEHGFWNSELTEEI